MMPAGEQMHQKQDLYFDQCPIPFYRITPITQAEYDQRKRAMLAWSEKISLLEKAH